MLHRQTFGELHVDIRSHNLSVFLLPLNPQKSTKDHQFSEKKRKKKVSLYLIWVNT